MNIETRTSIGLPAVVGDDLPHHGGHVSNEVFDHRLRQVVPCSTDSSLQAIVVMATGSAHRVLHPPPDVFDRVEVGARGREIIEANHIVLLTPVTDCLGSMPPHIVLDQSFRTPWQPWSEVVLQYAHVPFRVDRTASEVQGGLVIPPYCCPYVDPSAGWVCKGLWPGLATPNPMNHTLVIDLEPGLVSENPPLDVIVDVLAAERETTFGLALSDMRMRTREHGVKSKSTTLPCYGAFADPHTSQPLHITRKLSCGRVALALDETIEPPPMHLTERTWPTRPFHSLERSDCIELIENPAYRAWATVFLASYRWVRLPLNESPAYDAGLGSGIEMRRHMRAKQRFRAEQGLAQTNRVSSTIFYDHASDIHGYMIVQARSEKNSFLQH